MSASAAPFDPAAGGAGVGVGVLAEGLAGAVDALVSVPHDELDEEGLRAALAADERAIRRLQAHQADLSATLTRRRAVAARQERPDDPRAGDKAARQVRRELSDGLGMTPSQAKQTTATGRQMQDLGCAREAFAAGRITARHVRVIAEVTAHFVGDERAQFEAELVALAQQCRDAVAFGRAARGRLIERDHDAAMADLESKKARRSGRLAQSEHGTTHLVLDTAGYAGELVHTVVDAFRQPDAAGEHRTAEQRTHDAIITAFEVALGAGKAPTRGGVRPHVSLVFRAESVQPRDGAADTVWTGQLPYGEVARLLGDCSLSRLVADANDVPLRVSKKVRTVPAGLQTHCEVRDGGCIWDGCHAPPSWCEMAHLGQPYADGGKLAPDTAGLLCGGGANHHARFDQGDYQVIWIDGRPKVLAGDGRPVAEHQRGRWDPALDPDPPPDTDPPAGTDPPPEADPPPPPTLPFASETRGRYCTAPPRPRRPTLLDAP